jgi:hypothetical protein
MIALKEYKAEIICIYKGERFSVRDNGAVLRYPLEGKKPRPTDNLWTFGKHNKKTGYLEIASVRIHRIIATSFHGDPPTKDHVVDHIDTNKQNNRPENLRWVTRLENILLNPITVRRIELVCGSLEEFLSDPLKFRDKFQEPNYQWMCTVSIQEAQTSKERLLDWAKSDKQLNRGTLGDWIYNRSLLKEKNETLDIINSLTPNAVQKVQSWRIPSEFPFCPQEKYQNPITTYYKNLNISDIFFRNQFTSYLVERFAISKDAKRLWIMCISGENNQIKPYSLAEVTYQNDVFVHNSLGTFFQKEGAEKQFTILQGLEWAGGETFDDQC